MVYQGGKKETSIYNGKTYSEIPKNLKFFNECLALELLFTIAKINGTCTIEKLWCYGKKLWNFDLHTNFSLLKYIL